MVTETEETLPAEVLEAMDVAYHRNLKADGRNEEADIEPMQAALAALAQHGYEVTPAGENARLRDDVAKLKGDVSDLTSRADSNYRHGAAALATVDSEREANARLTDEVARLREALEFYASRYDIVTDRKKWLEPAWEFRPNSMGAPALHPAFGLQDDQGKRARAALHPGSEEQGS